MSRQIPERRKTQAAQRPVPLAAHAAGRVLTWRSEAYESFRTGLCFSEVRQILEVEREQRKRHHVTRRTVLGKWHEIKLKMWREELDYEKYLRNREKTA